MAEARTHSLLIPKFLFPFLNPSIPLLIFIFASAMRTKESTHCPLYSWFPLPLFLGLFLGLSWRGSQAWLVIVTWPHGGKIGTHAQTQMGSSLHTHLHTYKQKWQRGEQEAVLPSLNTPWAKPGENDKVGGGGGGIPFQMSDMAWSIHMLVKVCQAGG